MKEPVAWRIKDYADNWILTQNKELAELYIAEGLWVQALGVMGSQKRRPKGTIPKPPEPTVGP